MWISWDPGARGRAPCGTGLDGITRESWPYRNLAILEPPRGMDDSMAPRLDFQLISSILNDSRWSCVDFMNLGVFWGRMFPPGLDGSRGPIRSLQSGNLQNLMTEPGGLQAWRLAASMKRICMVFMDS